MGIYDGQGDESHEGHEGYEGDEGNEGEDHVNVGGRVVRCHLVEGRAEAQGCEGGVHRAPGIAASEIAKGKFVIPQVVMLKLKHKPARPAGKRMMFGKEVKVAAKKASKVVKAFPAAAIKKSI